MFNLKLAFKPVCELCVEPDPSKELCDKCKVDLQEQIEQWAFINKIVTNRKAK